LFFFFRYPGTYSSDPLGCSRISTLTAARTLSRIFSLAIFCIVKRVFDICASLPGPVICSPVMLDTAIAIKAYDGGSALCKQAHLTKDEREFRILEFRSMRVDAEKDGVAGFVRSDSFVKQAISDL
jgi:lipopolysaccharide/colanic/teichoic acid biosynthesis glycosyltransferase